MTLRALLATSVALSAAAVVMLPSPAARACGGFFCNAQTLTPIVQAGERILFARHDDRVTMHIEVAYAGEPTQFGWILPLPEVPTDPAGQPVPLDQIVQISSQIVFDTLQSATAPTFRVNNTFGPDQCERQFGGGPFPSSGGFDSSTSADSAADVSAPAPAVVVLQEAKVGPYNAQLIQATETQALYDWLNKEGYFQDPAALPLLDHYLGGGYVFLGIKLQTGKGNGDLKPLSLTFSEAAPCVPLRLTAIAATPAMPILVWVLGEGRAIPKNFIHAIVNDQALTFPGASSYQQVVSDAIDELQGRAWVTEYAQPASQLSGSFISKSARNTGPLLAATTWQQFSKAIRDSGLAQSSDYTDILTEEIAKPEGLRGFPFGNCYFDPSIPEGQDQQWGCEANDDHITTDAEFYGFLDFWLAEADAGRIDPIEVDVATIAARIAQEIVGPLARVEDLLAAPGAVLTRFFTRIDPGAMDRDPIFAFNKELPNVSPAHVVETLIETDAQCQSLVIATYADGSKYTFDCGGGCFGTPSIGPVPGAPALLTAEVLDETGLPKPFDPTQSKDIDTLLAAASPGSPSLPESFKLLPPRRDGNPVWPNPPGGGGTAVSGGGGPAGCQGGGLGVTLGLSLAALFALAWLGRRRDEA
ncbi:MAG: DUF2330 domain-containing protein [Myxococcota bacterium]